VTFLEERESVKEGRGLRRAGQSMPASQDACRQQSGGGGAQAKGRGLSVPAILCNLLHVPHHLTLTTCRLPVRSGHGQ